MAERPILFSAPMVRAILDGRKTQTRRIVKPSDAEAIQFMAGGIDDAPATKDDFYIEWRRWLDDNGKEMPEEWCLYSMEYPEEGCLPLGKAYGRPGDLLWVRETWFADPPDDGTWSYTSWAGCRDSRASDIPDRFCTPEHCIYAASWNGVPLRWTPSIHMPRWASRITLGVGKTRIERLQDISSTDALAEGIEAHTAAEKGCTGAYRDLWDSINGAGSWDANPWVWVVEFQRVVQSGGNTL